MTGVKRFPNRVRAEAAAAASRRHRGHDRRPSRTVRGARASAIGLVAVTALVLPVAVGSPAAGAPVAAKRPPLGDPGCASAPSAGTPVGPIAAGSPSGPYATPGLGLPTWADTQWAPAEYNDTIQLGDVDGDGLSELFGRSANGLDLQAFDDDTGQWLPLGSLDAAPFSDADGWTEASSYETLQTGDIDGFAGVEVFGRSADGVVVESFDPDSHSWVSYPTLDHFTDSQGLDRAEYYRTLQSADVDGSQRASVLGRTPGGVKVFQYQPSPAEASAGTWEELPTLDTFITPHWDEAEYYSTLQTADLDGDGRDEVLARNRGGLEAYTYDPTTKGWTALPVLSDLGDADGWAGASHYATIQTADLDGDGAADVLGRGKDGIVAWRFLEGAWVPLPGLTGDFTDAGGWQQAKYFSTIQTGDVDGDGADEVIGRAANGLHTWSLHTSTKKWVELGVSGPFPDDAGWHREMSYPTILVGEIGLTAQVGGSSRIPDPRAEVIGRGPTGVQTYRWNTKGLAWESPSAVFPDYSTGAAGKAYDQLNSMFGGTIDPGFDLRTAYQTASDGAFSCWTTTITALTASQLGVAASVWTPMQAQLLAEIGAAKGVADWFEVVRDRITEMIALKGFDGTTTRLSYSESSKASLEASVFNIFGGVVRSAAVAGGPAGSAIGGLVATAISAGVGFATSPTTGELQGDYVKIEAGLETSYQDALTGNGNARAAVAADYGRLTAGDLLIEALVWAEPQSDVEARMTAASLRSYTISTWQMLTPAIWNVYAGNDDEYCSNAQGACWGLYDGLFLHVKDEFVHQLFHSPDSSCATTWDFDTCNLDQSKEDVFRGRDGWNIPCRSDEYSNAGCPPGA